MGMRNLVLPFALDSITFDTEWPTESRSWNLKTKNFQSVQRNA